MSKSFQITHELVNKVLDTVDKGLVMGLGVQKPGQMCVEAAVCYAMGLPHGDAPTCVDPAIRALKIGINDSNWSSAQARAKGLRRLSILQLGTKDSGFNSTEFARNVVIMVVNTILPITLRHCGLIKEALDCEQSKTLSDAAGSADAAADAAAWAARYAAAEAADAAAEAADAAAEAAAEAADAAARYAARSAAEAAAEAADAADSDEILSLFTTNVENILINMNVPAVPFLPSLSS